MGIHQPQAVDRWRTRPGRAPSRSPWRTVWLSPRQTMWRVLRGDAARFVIVVAWLSGAQDILKSTAMGADMRPTWGPYAVFLALAMGPLLGMMYFWLVGGLISIAARLVGGTAGSSETRVALAAGTVCQLIALPLWPVVMAYYGLEIFTSAQPEGAIGLMAFAGFQLLLWLVSWVVQIAALAEVHRFSAWRALLSMVLGVVANFALVVGALLGAAFLIEG